MNSKVNIDIELPSHKTIKAASGVLDKLHPYWVGRLQRNIVPPTGYINPKHWWAQEAVGRILDDEIQRHSTDFRTSLVNNKLRTSLFSIWSFTATKLLKYDSPTYFVSSNLINALNDTDIENSIPMESLEWPHEAMLFIIPDNIDIYCGTEKDGTKTRARAISICKVNKDEYVYPPSVSALSNSPSEEALKINIHSNYGVTVLDDIGNQIFRYIKCLGTFFDQLDIAAEQHEGDSRESVMPSCRLAYKLLCIMNCKDINGISEVVFSGSRIERKEKIKNGKIIKNELWSPNMLTLSQNINYSDSDLLPHSSRAKVRFHWRRGHFRKVHFGTGNVQMKIMWIRPTKVGKLI